MAKKKSAQKIKPARKPEGHAEALAVEAMAQACEAASSQEQVKQALEQCEKQRQISETTYAKALADYRDARGEHAAESAKLTAALNAAMEARAEIAGLAQRFPGLFGLGGDHPAMVSSNFAIPAGVSNLLRELGEDPVEPIKRARRIRRLDAQLDDGEITPEEHVAATRKLMAAG